MLANVYTQFLLGSEGGVSFPDDYARSLLRTMTDGSRRVAPTFIQDLA